VPGLSLWQHLAVPATYAVGSALVPGVPGTMYTQHADFADTYRWVHGHLHYVSHLWDECEMRTRLHRISELECELGVCFSAYNMCCASCSTARSAPSHPPVSPVLRTGFPGIYSWYLQ
jgi:hypothetical protein